jgi:hypothetical protein
MAVQKELQQIFRKRVGGWRDEKTLERVRRLCFKGRMAVNDGYCREEIGAIEIGQPIADLEAGPRLIVYPD